MFDVNKEYDDEAMLYRAFFYRAISHIIVIALSRLLMRCLKKMATVVKIYITNQAFCIIHFIYDACWLDFKINSTLTESWKYEISNGHSGSHLCITGHPIRVYVITVHYMFPPCRKQYNSRQQEDFASYNPNIKF